LIGENSILEALISEGEEIILDIVLYPGKALGGVNFG